MKSQTDGLKNKQKQLILISLSRHTLHRDIRDPKKHLKPEGYSNLISKLNTGHEDVDPERAYFQRRLREFTKEAHSFDAETEMNCRPELSSFYHEMGNHSQSAIGFFQPCLDDDVIFLSVIAEGKMGALRDNPDKLRKLKNISPLLHDVYSSLRSEREETLFNKVTQGLYNIYLSCFDENPQWWEEEREVSPKMNEQYMISG